MSDPAGLDFLVQKDDWSQTRFQDSPVPEPQAGQVVFRVDRFALTANNITYALVGEQLGYWRFFPAPDGMGRIPVMGYGDVIRSAHPEVSEGTRCFGFYPMSRYLCIEPSSVSPSQIVDGAAHRAGLAPAYAQYSPSTGDALYAPDHEDALMLMRGLFMTSFLADDVLADADYYGASSVLISSASSKTSIALGHQVKAGGRARAVGLTSSRNRAFVSGLGCYDEVRTYDEVESLDAARPAVFVDMAGNGKLLRSVHVHFGDQLKHSCSIGATHWDSDRDASSSDLPGPKPQLFFAPAQIQKRSADWGPAELQKRLGEAWAGFKRFSDGWLVVKRGHGREALEHAYRETLAGKTDPSQGQVLSLFDAPS